MTLFVLVRLCYYVSGNDREFLSPLFTTEVFPYPLEIVCLMINGSTTGLQLLRY